MKSDVILRFVSVRPPRIRRPSDLAPIEESTVGRLVADELHRTAEIQRKPLAQVRKEWGGAVIQSDQYFVARHGDVIPRLGGDLRRMLGEIQINPSIESFLQRTEAMFQTGVLSQNDTGASVVGAPTRPSADDISGVLTRPDLWSDAWRSYYANVSNPYLRPMDRELLEDWIRALYLSQSTQDEERFKASCANVMRRRLAVPIEFFVERGVVAGQFVETIAPPVIDRSAALERSIASLQAAAHFIKDLYLQKLRGFGVDPNPVDVIPPRTPRKSSWSTASSPTAPWRVSLQDLQGREDIVRTLQGIGVGAEAQTIPHIIAAIEQAVAVQMSERQRLIHRNEIFSTDRTFVRVPRH